jgi:hypothetical protein
MTGRWTGALVLVLLAAGMTVLKAWRRRRDRQREADRIARLIRPPNYLFTGSDEQLAARTAKRRTAAENIRRRAANVETGSPVSDVLRSIK